MPDLTPPGRLVTDRDLHQLRDEMARDLILAATSAVRDRGVFHLALAPSLSLDPFFTDLVIDPRWRVMPWPLTHIWVSRGPQVQDTHETSSLRFIRENLVDHLTVRKRHVHGPTLDPEHYVGTLQEHFNQPSTAPRIDVVLLDNLAPFAQRDDRWVTTKDKQTRLGDPMLKAARKLNIYAPDGPDAALTDHLTRLATTPTWYVHTPDDIPERIELA